MTCGRSRQAVGKNRQAAQEVHRRPYKGKRPLHLSGTGDAPTDWLVALGYPPADAGVIMQQLGPVVPALALAA